MSSKTKEIVKSVKFVPKQKKAEEIRNFSNSRGVRKKIISDNEESLDVSSNLGAQNQIKPQSLERAKRKAKTDAIETLRLIKVFSKKNVKDITSSEPLVTKTIRKSKDNKPPEDDMKSKKVELEISEDDENAKSIEPIPEKSKNFKIDVIPHIIREAKTSKLVTEDLTS